MTASLALFEKLIKAAIVYIILNLAYSSSSSLINPFKHNTKS
jgi:hypothetical protein